MSDKCENCGHEGLIRDKGGTIALQVSGPDGPQAKVIRGFEFKQWPNLWRDGSTVGSCCPYCDQCRSQDLARGGPRQVPRMPQGGQQRDGDGHAAEEVQDEQYLSHSEPVDDGVSPICRRLRLQPLSTLLLGRSPCAVLSRRAPQEHQPSCTRASTRSRFRPRQRRTVITEESAR